MFEHYKDVVNIRDLAEMLGVGRNTAYELIKNGDIRAIKVKTQIRIPKEAVIDYLRGATPPYPR